MSTPKVRYKINLKDLFDGVSVEDKALREAIGGAIIERIKSRAESGVDKNGNKFKPYSQSYKESLQFKAFGKSNQVDMTLTGDMLGTLEMVKDSPNQLVFGWEDETQNAKAYNHTTGDTVPKRDFFGLPKEEVEEIVSEFSEDVKSFKDLAESRGTSDFDRTAVSFIARLLGRSSG
jgi:hypothetical protein